ncbi:MAG: folate hydrolase [Gammaproteobacteria bacterium TMED78]|mgnify:CR=1 FL=1|nr:MAG: folate hydrolase [Gammaproteobacteria bacterium TMED78]|tara:strand:+ start:18616 stop:20838 length:2223 start_codon:yes stop_codon:yes gene_type:complete
MQILLIFFIAIALPISLSAQSPLGLNHEETHDLRTLEKEFDSHIDRQDMHVWMREMSSRPHHIGSEWNKHNRYYIASLLESWGYEVSLDEFNILFPSPNIIELELISPLKYTASLTEMPVDGDVSTFNTSELIPPYNAFSIDGDIEGELVFVNYGVPEDYELLERFGIEVKGKIVIAKYGRSWRGIKPKLAAEKGAIGAIIYSDPEDYGYTVGDVYPDGAWLNDTGVQRGSVMDMPLYPGDVLTPGVGAVKGEERLDIDEVQTLTKIPVMPISYSDALPLLSSIGNEVAPNEWQGSLPITYHLGPGPAKVRMRLEFNWDMIPIYNVIARLEGSIYPDEWVMRGNHFDAWNFGAADPISGLVSMLAEAKAISEMVKNGYSPSRTIIYGAWDAEEEGLIGSTEWVEHNAETLKRNLVSYVNTDGGSKGFLNIGGSHTLENFFNDIIKDVNDPSLNVSLFDRKVADLLVNGSDEEKDHIKKGNDLRINALGSGSDYSPFLQHLGVASAHLNFSGEGDGGSYHTLYDTYEHYTSWRDPDLVYREVLAKVAGRSTLRLSESRILPFNFSNFLDTVNLYLREIKLLSESLRLETRNVNSLLDEDIYRLALDPAKSFSPPRKTPNVPFFNFSILDNNLDMLSNAISIYEKAYYEKGIRPENIIYLNKLLYQSERLLTRDHGLPNRPWYKHHIYAPGFYTGYGVKTIPGVREAIEENDFEIVDQQIIIVADIIKDLANNLLDASNLFY